MSVSPPFVVSTLYGSLYVYGEKLTSQTMEGKFKLESYKFESHYYPISRVMALLMSGLSTLTFEQII